MEQFFKESLKVGVVLHVSCILRHWDHTELYVIRNPTHSSCLSFYCTCPQHCTVLQYVYQ